MKGSGPLWDELHALLETGAQPTPIHRFFASLPPLLRERGAPHQLIVTTSYDLALEQALLEAGEEFDVVSYIASGRHRGRFCHLAPDGTARADRAPEHLRERALARAADGHPQAPRPLRSLARARVGELRRHRGRLHRVPGPVGRVRAPCRSGSPRSCSAATSSSSATRWPTGTCASCCRRLWGEHPLSYRSWAVQPDAKPLEREFWRRLDVDVLEAPLEEYVELLEPPRRGDGARMSDGAAPREPVQGARAVRRLGARRAALLRARARRRDRRREPARLAADRALRRERRRQELAARAPWSRGGSARSRTRR